MDVPEDCPIQFRHPSPIYGHSWSKLEFESGAFAEHYQHQSTNGELLVFPSWLVHYVPPNYTDKDRISISFDLV